MGCSIKRFRVPRALLPPEGLREFVLAALKAFEGLNADERASVVLEYLESAVDGGEIGLSMEMTAIPRAPKCARAQCLCAALWWYWQTQGGGN